jgi:hypothetical protein
MSRFYVGQRVRVIASTNYPKLIGCEAVVDGFYEGRDEEGEYRSDWVELDISGHPSAQGWICTPDEIEPITDSYDKVEWSDCLWRPQHDEASA